MIPSSVYTNLRGKPWSHLQESLGGSENQQFRSSLKAEGNPTGTLAQCQNARI